VSSSGNLYRLRNGVFNIIGMETGHEVVVNTEDDPDLSRIEVDVPSDEYLVFLESGYYLEKVGSEEPDFSATARSAKGDRRLERALLTTDLRAQALAAGGAGGASAIPGFAGAAPVPGAGGEGPVPGLGGAGPIPGAAGAMPGVGGGGPDDGTFEAILISENPAFVFVAPYETSVVVFRFRIGDEVVVTDSGTIAIEIEVEEGSACEDDEFEPNDGMEQATSVASDAVFDAVACDYDDDWYVFEAPTPEGEIFGVFVTFTHADGDIDALLFNEEGMIVSGGMGVTDQETLAAASDGGLYYLLVYTYNTSNSYHVEITDQVEDLMRRSHGLRLRDGPLLLRGGIRPALCNGSNDGVRRRVPGPGRLLRGHQRTGLQRSGHQRVHLRDGSAVLHAVVR